MSRVTAHGFCEHFKRWLKNYSWPRNMDLSRYLNIDNLTNRKHVNVGVACFVLYHPKKIENMDSNKLLPSDELTISDWKMDPE